MHAWHSKVSLSAAERLGEVIHRRRAEIERTWLERVRRELAHTPGVSPVLLRDGLPDYLVALADIMRAAPREVPLGVGAAAAWEKVTRQHGITRVRIGFDLEQLIGEFAILRQTIRDVALSEGVIPATPESTLADIINSAIALAVQAYVDARDFDGRRKQAEHIGFLTHELRSPLSSAMMAASELREHAPPELLPLLDLLDRKHSELEGLIGGVLLTEKLEAGKGSPKQIDLAMGPLLDPILATAREAAAAKGIDFNAEYDPELRVRADPELAHSAVQNIIDNAVKYTDRGGVDVMVEDDGDGVVIHVYDSCWGISPEELATIFEPFERGRTAKKGTGLGLAIARRAVEVQGGTIGVESPNEFGCHFWLRLPKK
jgi:signal transduction histidine kinase